MNIKDKLEEATIKSLQGKLVEDVNTVNYDDTYTQDVMFDLEYALASTGEAYTPKHNRLVYDGEKVYRANYYDLNNEKIDPYIPGNGDIDDCNKWVQFVKKCDSTPRKIDNS